jgi:radical SAM protein with 4Fe4S-binding SPASM domain
MESVFVDRFEDGGLGSQRAEELKPSLAEFRIALGQMIKGRDDFGIPVGWGTAIPFCLDSRLVKENMTADCGAGVTFAAVNPKGEVRTCNQSERVYGNILVESMGDIWRKPALDEFRGLTWVEKPCLGCRVLHECLCGCKVDSSSAATYSVDYAVRGNTLFRVPGSKRPCPPQGNCPPVQTGNRRFHTNRYTHINAAHRETYLVTRYQTVEIDGLARRMLDQIGNGIASEDNLIALNADEIDAEEVARIVSLFVDVGAIDIEGV